MTRCEQCGERQGSDSGQHFCAARDNRTGFHIGDQVRVGESTGEIVQLQTRGEHGMAKVYFRSQLASGWYPTGQLGRVAA